jgi:hypothetical protein
MDLKAVFNKAAELGAMPKVRIDKPVRHSELTEGVITNIRTFGIGVRFPDKNYDDWFWFEKNDDKRSKYTDCLELCDGNQPQSKDGKLPIPHVVGRSEQLICPKCKTYPVRKNSHTMVKECMNCGHRWAN